MKQKYWTSGVKWVAFAAILASMASCATPPPAPVYRDPLAGLIDKPQAIAEDAAVPLRQPAVVVLSSNVETYLAYVEQVDKSLKSFGPLTNTSAVADIDPHALAASVLDMLKSRLPTVTLVDDLNGALNAGAKTVCVVDIQISLGTVSGTTTRSTISAIFLDERMRPVSKISGHGSATIPYPAWSIGVRPAVAAALLDLKGKLMTKLAAR